MINARHDKAGRRLIITADNDGRAALADAYRSGGYRGAESEVAQAFHEAYELRDADDTPDAWLTSAPFIIDADGVNYCDNGQFTVWEGTPIFQFPDYAVEDPWETLKNRGRVEWPEVTADPEEYPAPPSRAFIESHFTGGSREGVLIWIGAMTFPGVEYDAVPKAWPELTREDDPESWDCGLYFWRDGRRHGPFSNSPRGVIDAENAGGRFEPKPPSRDPDQPEMELAA